jgi:mono/diheme cytochrome c family protein
MSMPLPAARTAPEANEAHRPRPTSGASLTWTGLLTLTALLALTCIATAQKMPWPNVGEDPGVTPVSGPSWLNHLGVTLRGTWIGQGSGRYGPAPGKPAAPANESLGVRRVLTLTGADLYRLNCQACHRAAGTGEPPEIHSVLGPVQGTSLELVRQRLRAQHDPTAARDSRVEANRARAQILTRLHKGGTRMPPRDYLQDEDIRVLFTYLTELAGVPGARRQATRTVSWARLGELTVKGTCHICHDAVGPRPSPEAMLHGAIPPLQSLLQTKSVAEFVHKARNGEVVRMGSAGEMHRGRMPVFYYLHDEEIAGAYMYLATYQPE